ncbi:MAG: DUF131 domain-containing protein [Candidatus Bathyarchaeota archaeon]|nr:DUF131 domain-containing protein [Candidatus Bathyarchaeota archaeon]
MADYTTLYSAGFALILVGIVVLIAAAILISITQGSKGNSKTAGAIIIGPVPIIFGSDKKSVKTILTMSVALTALLIAAMLIYYFLLR